MDKPLTARQFAIILWGPVLIGLAVWGLVATFTQQDQRQADRHAASSQAAGETDRAAQRLQRNLDALNQQTEER